MSWEWLPAPDQPMGQLADAISDFRILDLTDPVCGGQFRWVVPACPLSVVGFWQPGPDDCHEMEEIFEMVLQRVLHLRSIADGISLKNES